MARAIKVHDLKSCPFHGHALTFIKDGLEPYRCRACGLSLLSTPSYGCPEYIDCVFFLHKTCTQLPLELNYITTEGREHSLALAVPTSTPSPPYLLPHFICEKCGESRKSLMVYWRKDQLERDMSVHASCAFPLEIKHDSHEHKLVCMRRKAKLLCDACGEEDEGFFFTCKDSYPCDFWIHKRCAELPTLVEIASHHHFLQLSYFAFGENCKFTFDSGKACKICHNKFSGKAAYYCADRECEYVAHLNCVASRFEEDSELPVHLAFWMGKIELISQSIRRRNIGNLLLEPNSKIQNEIVHQHSLLQTESDGIEDTLCNACMQPVCGLNEEDDSPYRCEEPGCDFLLHSDCAHSLSSTINIELLATSSGKSTSKSGAASLVSNDPSSLSSIYTCQLCGHRSNGIGYEIKINNNTSDSNQDPNAPGIVDFECASLPRKIRHGQHHNRHILRLISGSLADEALPFNCCSDDFKDDVKHLLAYKCSSCRAFKIHAKCALLLRQVSHKFDKHNLHLCTSTFHVVDDSEHYFCEICEEDINTELWFYHCERCVHFFHTKCIPLAGKLSKIKFGYKIKIKCHPRMTLTRMLENGSQRCVKCKQVIQGFKDDIALHCSECCDWIHFDCAEEA